MAFTNSFGFEIKIGKIKQSIEMVNTFFYKIMNFSVTTWTKFTEIFYLKILFVCIYMMNFHSFFRTFRNRTDKTFIWNISITNELVTPWFIFSSIKKMIRSFKGMLTFSRTKSRLFFFKRQTFIFFTANYAYLWDFWFSSAIKTTISRCFNSVITWMIIFSASFTDFNNFRFFSHRKKLYAN